jgi:hypothetical protein
MRPVERVEIVDLAAYEAERDGFRARVLAAKQPRRVALGANMTLLFENRDTVRYQVQEMLRVERITGETEIGHELATYNELVPRDGELSATLLVEYPDVAERDRKLRELRGLEQGRVKLAVGRESVEAEFDGRQVGTDRLSSVHYLRFRLPPSARAAFRREGLSGGVRLVVDHPAYGAQCVLLPHQVNALAADLEAV